MVVVRRVVLAVLACGCHAHRLQNSRRSSRPSASAEGLSSDVEDLEKEALGAIGSLLLSLNSASAFSPSVSGSKSIHKVSPLSRSAFAPSGRRQPSAIITARPQTMRAAQPAALFDGDFGTIQTAVGVLVVLFGLSRIPAVAAVVPLLLIFLGGDPDDSEKATGENKAVKAIVEEFTPSAWKKAYLGENAVTADGEKVLLDLPEWQGQDARELVEKEAVDTLKAMQYEPIDVPGVGTIKTSFLSLKPEPSKAIDAPPIFLIHGFDSSVLEFRYIAPTLTEAGLRVEAMEWWTGGFTDRKPILDKIEAGEKPWDLIREHLYAYWKKQLNGQKVVLLGASLGGAAAIDFAVTHPECVEGMILLDAGGQSYAQPDPFLTSVAADPVTNFFQWRANNGLLPYPQVWWKEENWRQSLRGYLKSGGYQVRTNPDLIRQVPVPTKVLWGEEDDVLPVEDAYKYEQDLPNCVGVQLIPDAQHAPALENPPYVAEQLIAFAKQMGEQQKAAQTA